MTSPVVTVTRPFWGRVTVKWFADPGDAARDAWVARATSQEAQVRGYSTDEEVLRATCMRTLLADGVDVAWCATHHRKHPWGKLVPLGAAGSEEPGARTAPSPPAGTQPAPWTSTHRFGH